MDGNRKLLLWPRREFAAVTARGIWADHPDWGDGPVPVDCWLQELGVRVAWWGDQGLCDDPAWTFRDPDGRFFTFLNPNLKKPNQAGRLNWTKAFEGGHIVLGHLDFNAPDLPAAGEKALRTEANIFTRELLMPDRVMRQHIRDTLPPGAEHGLLPWDLADLRTWFDVSWDALLIRLEELRIQSKAVSEAVFALYHHDSGRRFARQVLDAARRVWTTRGYNDPTGRAVR